MSEQRDALFDVEALIAERPPSVDSRAQATRSHRNKFRVHPAPTKPMSSSIKRLSFRPSNEPVDPAVQPFVDWFEAQPDARERFRWALRDSLDELLDGQRTGRWCYQHLLKTEKTYLGTAVEVNLTKEFDVAAGHDLDWRIAGQDIDCKFSKDLTGWELPMEMYLCADHGEQSGRADHVALLTWFDDDNGLWAAGLIKVTDGRLRWKDRKGMDSSPVRAYNRDNKRRLAAESFSLIHWLWGGLQRDLPTNLLLALPAQTRAKILAGSSGQARVNQLFSLFQGRIVGRSTLLTVAQQDDAPKRARDTRIRLRAKGIVVLGHQDSHPAVAAALNLTVPVKGEWISCRLARINGDGARSKVWIDGSWWAVAHDSEAEEPAPEIPKKLIDPPVC